MSYKEWSKVHSWVVQCWRWRGVIGSWSSIYVRGWKWTLSLTKED